MFLLNSDAWVAAGDALERLVAFADAHPAGRGRRAAARATPTGRCSARCAASRRSGGSRPSTSSCASSAPRTRALNAFYGGGFALRRAAPGRVAPGRGAARPARGGRRGRALRRELLHVQRGDRLALPLPAAGWEVWFTPGAEVVHLGGASHGGAALRREPARDPPLPRQAPGRDARRRGRGCCCSGRCGCGRSSSAASAARATATARVSRLRRRAGAARRDRRVRAARASRPASCCCPATSSRGALGQRGARAGVRLGVRLRSFSPGRPSSSSTGRSGSPPRVLAAIGARRGARRRVARRSAPAEPPPAERARRAGLRRAGVFAGGVVLGLALWHGRGRRRRRRALPRGAASASSSTSPTSTCARSTSSRAAGSIPGTPSRSGTASSRSSRSSRGSIRRSSSHREASVLVPLACLRRLGGRASRSSARPWAGVAVLAASLGALLLRGGARRLVRLARAAGDRRAAAARPGGVSRSSSPTPNRRGGPPTWPRWPSAFGALALVHPTYALFALIPLGAYAVVRWPRVAALARPALAAAVVPVGLTVLWLKPLVDETLSRQPERGVQREDARPLRLRARRQLGRTTSGSPPRCRAGPARSRSPRSRSSRWRGSPRGAAGARSCSAVRSRSSR